MTDDVGVAAWPSPNAKWRIVHLQNEGFFRLFSCKVKVMDSSSMQNEELSTCKMKACLPAKWRILQLQSEGDGFFIYAKWRIVYLQNEGFFSCKVKNCPPAKWRILPLQSEGDWFFIYAKWWFKAVIYLIIRVCSWLLFGLQNVPFLHASSFLAWRHVGKYSRRLSPQPPPR